MNKMLMFGIIGSACLLSFLGGSILSGSIGAQSGSLFPSQNISFPSFSFTQDIGLGTDSQDVRQLQIFLNSDPDTVVATGGVGSSGNEGTFFGQLIKQFFQLMYNLKLMEYAHLDYLMERSGQGKVNRF